MDTSFPRQDKAPAAGADATHDVHTGSASVIRTPTSRDAVDDPLLEFASEQPAPSQSLFVIVPAELSDDLTGGWSTRVNHTYRGLWEKRTRVARHYLSDRVTGIGNQVRRVAAASLDNTRRRVCNAGERPVDLVRRLKAADWPARVHDTYRTYRGAWDKRTRVARRDLSNQVTGIENRVRRVAVASLDNARALVCYAAKQSMDLVRRFKVPLVPVPKSLPRRLAFVAAIASMVIWLVRVEVPSNVATAGESQAISIDAESRSLAESRQSTAPNPVTQQSAKVANLLDVDTPRPPAATATALRDTPAVARQGRPAATRFRGTLAVDSQPRGARVFINGQSVGTTPVVLRQLPIGSRAVRIEAAGYQAWSASIRVVANQQTPVKPILSPLPR